MRAAVKATRQERLLQAVQIAAATAHTSARNRQARKAQQAARPLVDRNRASAGLNPLSAGPNRASVARNQGVPSAARVVQARLARTRRLLPASNSAAAQSSALPAPAHSNRSANST